MIEAMACGTPVIAFRRGSVPEVIERRRRPASSSTASTRRSRRCGASAQLDRRAAAAPRSSERFTAARMARDYVTLYRGCWRSTRADAAVACVSRCGSVMTRRQTIRGHATTSWPRRRSRGRPPRVLKHGDTFAVFDRFGDIAGRVGEREGLYHEGTRFLSRLRAAPRRPRGRCCSSSTVQRRQRRPGRRSHQSRPRRGRRRARCAEGSAARRSRSKFLWRGALLRAAARVTNYGREPVEIAVCDSLRRRLRRHLRGARRRARARAAALRPPQRRTRDGRCSPIDGLDGVRPRARASASTRRRADSTATRAQLRPRSSPARARRSPYVECECRLRRRRQRGAELHDAALAAHAAASRGGAARACAACVSLERAVQRLAATARVADLRDDVTDNAARALPLRRRALVQHRRSAATASSPPADAVARARRSRAACSRFLAAHQADRAWTRERTPSPARSCTRCAAARWRALGEVPFGRYYGSVDSTPLFVMLAGAYFERTGDRATSRELWPARRARARLDRATTATATATASSSTRRRSDERPRAARAGRTRTTRSSTRDGTLAEAPIALCEVQGYVYAA